MLIWGRMDMEPLQFFRYSLGGIRVSQEYYINMKISSKPLQYLLNK